MGVEPFLLASTLQGVLAQRLIRLLCPSCKKDNPDGTAEWNPSGCPTCRHTGYRGRTGVHELFVVDDATRVLIHNGGNEQALREHAAANGMRSLHQDGQRWVRQGLTTAAELARVTYDV